MSVTNMKRTQGIGENMAESMWMQLRQLIVESRRLEDPMEEITEEDVRRGIKMMSSSTAVGIDQWSPAQWKKLSPEAIEAITHLFTYIEKYGVWPGHIYYNIIVLMGKPNGGVRPIALTAMIYRLWTKIRRPYVVEWEKLNAGPWDAAIKGSSALRAGILSVLCDETAV